MVRKNNPGRTPGALLVGGKLFVVSSVLPFPVPLVAVELYRLSPSALMLFAEKENVLLTRKGPECPSPSLLLNLNQPGLSSSIHILERLTMQCGGFKWRRLGNSNPPRTKYLISVKAYTFRILHPLSGIGIFTFKSPSRDRGQIEMQRLHFAREITKDRQLKYSIFLQNCRCDMY